LSWCTIAECKQKENKAPDFQSKAGILAYKIKA
jgi:hypothetical protein